MQKKLRILQVVNVRWFNATAWYGLRLSRLLKDAGHEVCVLGLQDTASFAKAQEMGLNPVALNINTLNPFGLFPGFTGLVKLLRDFSPDIVNCHRGEGFVYFALLKKMGFPFALVRTRGDQRRPQKTLINQYLHNTASEALITTNAHMKKVFMNKFATSADHIRVILGGVDTETFAFSTEGRARLRAELGIADNERVVGLLGRFDPVKGHETLIKAMALLKDRYPHLRLMLAGRDSAISHDEMKTLASQAGLDNAVLLGECDDVPACISAMDIGVIASLGSETIARVALEMISCGIPVIGSNVGVMPDILPGWALFTPGQPAALASCLGGLVESEQQRDSLLRWNKNLLSTIKDEAFLAQTMEVYEQALASRKTRG